MEDLTKIQAFRIARERFEQSMQDLVERFGYSRQYIYECLKYPNKNPDLHKQICEYINDAGLELPESRSSTTNMAEAS